MKVLAEPGVLIESERFFSTPSALAQRIFLYITRCGHYYCDEQYDFRDTSSVAQEKSHRNYCLTYVRDGEWYYEVLGDSGRVSAGQCALIDCRKPHRFFVRTHAETIWFHFNGAYANLLYDEVLARNGDRHVFPFSSSEAGLAELIAGIAQKKPLQEVEISSLLYSLLCDLLFPPLHQGSSSDDPIARALSYIEMHLTESLSVEQISSAVNLSSSHLSRLFRSRTGFSLHEYIILHRIDRAKSLLHDTDLTIREIAYQSGYQSEANFIASFTDKVGSTPTGFRKRPY